MNFNNLILFLIDIKTTNDQNDDEKPSCSSNKATGTNKKETDGTEKIGSDTSRISSLRIYISGFFSNVWPFSDKKENNFPEEDGYRLECGNYASKDTEKLLEKLIKLSEEKAEIKKQIKDLTTRTMVLHKKKKSIESRIKKLQENDYFCDNPSCEICKTQKHSFCHKNKEPRESSKSKQENGSRKRSNSDTDTPESSKRGRKEPTNE